MIVGERFETHKSMEHCTKVVQMTFPSKEGVVLIDRIGQNKKMKDIDISSQNVDLMTAQLTAPFADVVVQVILLLHTISMVHKR
jgi:hypothetical protein